MFDFEQKDSYDMDLEKINIQLVNSKTLTEELVGMFEMDMSVIYHQKNHELANCTWVLLTRCIIVTNYSRAV